MYTFIYAELNVFSTILLVFFAYKLYGIKALDRKTFSLMAYSQAAAFLLNAFQITADGQANVPVLFLHMWRLGYMVFLMLAIYFWIRFERIEIKNTDITSGGKIAILTPLIAVVIIGIISVFTGWLYEIDENHSFITGRFDYVTEIIKGGYIAFAVIYALFNYVTLVDPVRKRKSLIMSVFATTIFVAETLEIFLPDGSMACIVTTTAMIVVVFYFWDSFIETDRDLLKTAVNYAYPLTIYVNLSRNEFRIMENSLDDKFKAGDSGTYDELINSIYERIPLAERGTFLNNYRRDELTDAFNLGGKEVTRRYRSLGFDDGIMHWNEIRAISVSSEQSGDMIEAVLLIKPIDNEMNRELQLREARHTAESANSAKTRFLFNMSHDIRTPMNAIMGFTKIAEENLTNTDKVRDCLEKVRLSSTHLLKLINDVLDMSRIESGNIRLEEIPENLMNCGPDIIDMVQTSANERNIEFRVECADVPDKYIYVDKLRLNQVLLNIVSNSIKYTNPGGHILLSIAQEFPAKPGYGKYCFTVRDDGIGMSSDFVEHVFEQFSREQTVTVSGVEGTGLGMAITKQLVDLMGGDISVSSTPGKGTTVAVRVEFKLCEESAESDSKKSEIPVESMRGKRVLLVEDNELNREIACEILKSIGMEITEAENGQVAVARVIMNEPFDIILMDIQMPVMDGYEATRKIRQLPDPKNAVTPIVAMTANAFEEDKEKAYKAGMNGHISKPIDTENMLRTMCNAMRK